MQPSCTGTRKDGSTYPIEFRIFYSGSKQPVYILTGNDISARHASAKALRLSEARFRAIVSNTPGLFFQIQQRHDGNLSFPYLSDGCHALLGVAAERLRGDFSLFLNLILPDDRPSFLKSMNDSAAEWKTWSWDGRPPETATRIDLTVTPLEGGRCRVEVVHSGWERLPALRPAHDAGWAHFLGSLAALAEGRPFDRTFRP